MGLNKIKGQPVLWLHTDFGNADGYFAGDMSLTTVTSAPLNIQNMFGYSIQVVWLGSAAIAGSLKLQANSDGYGESWVDQDGMVKDDIPTTHWTDIPNSTQAVSGASGSHVWNVSDAYYGTVRVVYTGSAGTGSITAVIYGKGL